MLSQSEIETDEMNEFLNNVAKVHDLSVEEVIEDFNNVLNLVEKTKSSLGKPRQYVIFRAKSALDAHYKNKPKKGETFVIIPFCEVGKLRDWNETERKYISDAIKAGKMKDLMKEGKIFTVKKDGKDVPITSITKEQRITKFVVDEKVVNEKPINVENVQEITVLEALEGEEWIKGKGEPLFRDNRLFVNKLLNRGYSQNLSPRWSLNMTGICYKESTPDDHRLFDVRVQYEQADPTSDKFIFKTNDMFKVYMHNFEVDNDKSTAWKYVLKPTSIAFRNANLQIDDMGYMIMEELNKLWEKYHEEADKEQDFIPRLWYLHDISAYHLSAVNIEGDKVKKTPSGYDSTKWNAYGILLANTKINTSKTGKFYYNLDESSLGVYKTAFIGDSVTKIPAKLPGLCLIAFSTTRSSKRYDPSTKQTIVDPDNGDINLTIKSIVSAEVKEEEIPNIEKV